ncbi:MAG: type II toxin-antitoxin system VapC family toxin [Polyangiales bacterium]
MALIRVALDTNAYTDLGRDNTALRQYLEQADNIFLPFVVVAELRAGFSLGQRGQHNEARLRRFLAKDGVRILFADTNTTSTYASLYRQLRLQGTPVPTNDLWIAALAEQHALTLVSRDAHFNKLAQLRRGFW